MSKRVCVCVCAHIVGVRKIKILEVERPAGAKVLRLKRMQGA